MDGFNAIREEWERLWQVQAWPSPYTSWHWQQAWMESHQVQRRLYLVTVREEDGSLCGIAPLQRIPLFLPGVSTLAFMGQESSISPDFLALPGRERELCWLLVRHAAAQPGVAGLVLRLAEPVNVAGHLLHDHDVELAGRISATSYSQRLIIDLPDSYDAFLAGLSSKMRQEMRAARKKIGAEHQLRFMVDIVPGTLSDRLAEMFHLNDVRWGQSSGRSVYDRIYSALHETGMLRILTLYVDDRPAAVLSALSVGHALYSELAGFDYSIDRRHLGKCFYGMAIEWAIQNGYRHFDFSSGDEEYKLRFNPQVYSKHRVVIAAGAVKSLFLRTACSVAGRVRWLREPALT